MVAASHYSPEEDARPTRSERRWGMACHLVALTGFLMQPVVASVVAPLVLWLIKKDDSPFIDDQGRESLNFQLSVFIYTVVAVFLIPLLGIGLLLLAGLVVFDFVYVLIAAVKAGEGEAFRYPASLRLIK